MKRLAYVLLILGLVTASIAGYILTDGKIGEGWALVAFLIILFGDF